MAQDCRGLDYTAKDAAAVAGFDDVIAGYLGMARDTGDRLKAVFEADAEMPMANILKGYFFLLMASTPLKERAVAVTEGLAPILADANPRERLHGQALKAWAAGDVAGALRAWEDILTKHPRDILAMRLAHQGHFYKGDSQNVRDVVARRLHAWDADVPGYGFVMGMRAFGLEETHGYAQAIEAGKSALALNPNDPWAIHAVAHVYEMIDQPDDGIAWITAHEPGWTGAHNFRYHLYWHRALMRLDEGDYDGVLAAYDDELWDADSNEYLDLCNDASLLMRLELHGVDVGDRWQAVAEKCAARTEEHILAFVDAHYALALAAAGSPAADEVVGTMAAYAAASGEDNAAVSAEVGVALADAMVAYKTGDYGRAVDMLYPVRYEVRTVGGSHAQRDLFAMMLIDAALKAGRTEIARALAAERLGRLPTNAWTQAVYERSMAA